ncbi:MAG: hypothetical protein ACYCTG_05455 [Ferrimicrobium sp.]
MTEYVTFILLFPVLFFLSLVAFSIYAHGESELIIANDARTMALNEAYHLPAPCPKSSDGARNPTCSLVSVTISQNQIPVTVHMIDIRATTLTFGLLNGYVQAQAVVPSAKQASL